MWFPTGEVCSPCLVTDYYDNVGVYHVGSDGYLSGVWNVDSFYGQADYWWLRSPDDNNGGAYYVFPDGNIGFTVSWGSCGNNYFSIIDVTPT